MLSPVIYLLMNGLFFTLRLSGGGGAFPRPLKAAFNDQVKDLEKKRTAIWAEAEKGRRTTAQLEEIKDVLEQELWWNTTCV